MEKINMRAVFEKSGRAVYISHLDLVRTMQRAFKRAKAPVWYTQGYNPRIYLNFPLALSLGVSSKTEFMDFAVTEIVGFDELRDMLNDAMPEGLKILRVFEPVHPNKDIGFAEYCIDFYSADADRAAAALEAMMSMDAIEIDKRSKSKGTVKMDIKPHLDILGTRAEGDRLNVEIRLPAGLSLNINSNVFSDTFSVISGIKFDKICTERTKILLANGENFI